MNTHESWSSADRHDCTKAGESDHRDPAPQADHRASTGGDLSPPDHPAPADGLAPGECLDRTLRQGQRPATDSRCLTTQQPNYASEDDTWNIPDSEVRHNVTPSATHPTPSVITRSAPGSSAIEAK